MLVFIAYILLGAGAGFATGLFGIGGGLIVVPAFIMAFAVQGIGAAIAVPLAVGTSVAPGWCPWQSLAQ